MSDITQILIDNSDVDYQTFSKKLVPDTNFEMLGVRVPKIKEIAKNLVKSNRAMALQFLQDNYTYYEEYFLHGLIIGELKLSDSETINLIDKFLPSLDNWAICDSMVANLKIIKKSPKVFFEFIKKHISNQNPYATRFAIVCMLDYYLTDEYIDQVLFICKNITQRNYYVNMAISWLISVALIKQYAKTIKMLENQILPKFTHNKAIQKAIESFRINTETKEYLRTLKI